MARLSIAPRRVSATCVALVACAALVGMFLPVAAHAEARPQRQYCVSGGGKCDWYLTRAQVAAFHSGELNAADIAAYPQRWATPPGVIADVAEGQFRWWVEHMEQLRVWDAINEVVAYAVAVVNEQARQAEAAAAEAARQAALARQRAAPVVRPPVSAPAPAPAPAPVQSSGACGGATNGADQYIGRESGGNPAAANPSGAYGCYQIMPFVWNSNCSDLGGQIGASGSTQATCASRLPLCSWKPPNYCAG